VTYEHYTVSVVYEGRRQAARGEEINGPPKIRLLFAGFPHVIDIRRVRGLRWRSLSIAVYNNSYDYTTADIVMTTRYVFGSY